MNLSTEINLCQHARSLVVKDSGMARGENPYDTLKLAGSDESI